MSKKLTIQDLDGNVAQTVVIDKDGNVIAGYATKPQQVTYLGVPAIRWELRERGAHGRRTQYIHWLEKAVGQDVEWEAGTTTARTVYGNWDRGTQRTINETHSI